MLALLLIFMILISASFKFKRKIKQLKGKTAAGNGRKKCRNNGVIKRFD